MGQFNFRNRKEFANKLKTLDVHHGGEGSVYNDHQSLAIKKFNEKEVNIARKERKVRKLIRQFKTIGFDEVVFPLSPVTVSGHFVGYTMKYVKDAVDLDRIAEETFMGKRDLKDNLRLVI